MMKRSYTPEQLYALAQLGESLVATVKESGLLRRKPGRKRGRPRGRPRAKKPRVRPVAKRRIEDATGTEG